MQGVRQRGGPEEQGPGKLQAQSQAHLSPHWRNTPQTPRHPRVVSSRSRASSGQAGASCEEPGHQVLPGLVHVAWLSVQEAVAPGLPMVSLRNRRLRLWQLPGTQCPPTPMCSGTDSHLSTHSLTLTPTHPHTPDSPVGGPRAVPADLGCPLGQQGCCDLGHTVRPQQQNHSPGNCLSSWNQDGTWPEEHVSYALICHMRLWPGKPEQSANRTLPRLRARMSSCGGGGCGHHPRPLH